MGLNDYSEEHKKWVDKIDDLPVRLFWSDKVSRKTFFAFSAAEQYLKGARIQLDRYKQADIGTKFLELHYYLICIDKVHMLLKIIITKLENDDKALKMFWRRKSGFKRAFSFFRLARNALEHIDSRIDEGASDLGNVKGDKFTFTDRDGGEGQVSINQTELDRIEALFKQIFDILNSRPYGFAELKISEDKNSYYLWNVEE